MPDELAPTMNLALPLLLVNGSLIAAIYASAKFAAAGGIGALGVLAWQLLVAAIVISVVAALRGQRPRLTRPHLRYALLAGAVGILGPNLVVFSALAHVPAGTIGVITALSPAFTYLIALAVRHERLHGLRALGVLLGLAGAMAVVLPRGALPSADALPWALAALASPLMLGAGNVYRTVAWPASLPPLAAASLMLALMAALVLPIALLTGQFALPRSISSAADLGLHGTAVFMTLFYLGAFELQRRAGPVLTGQMGPVIALASLAIGWLALGETPPAIALLAVPLVLAGVALVTLTGARINTLPMTSR